MTSRTPKKPIKIELQRRQLTFSFRKITAPTATNIGDACVTAPTIESGTLVRHMTMPRRPTISAQYRTSKTGLRALGSFRFSPFSMAINAKIIKPPLIRKSMI